MEGEADEASPEKVQPTRRSARHEKENHPPETPDPYSQQVVFNPNVEPETPAPATPAPPTPHVDRSQFENLGYDASVATPAAPFDQSDRDVSVIKHLR